MGFGLTPESLMMTRLEYTIHTQYTLIELQ